MAVTILATNSSEPVPPTLPTYVPDAGAEVVVFASAMEASATTIDVADITITGSTSGTATLSGGTVGIKKAIASLSPDSLAFIFWVFKADLPVGTLTIDITYSGTPSTTQRRLQCYSLDSTTGAAEVDTTGSLAQTSGATTWAPTDLTCAAGSVQIYAANCSTNTSNTSPGSSPFFTERMDKNHTGGFRISAGDYTFAAGGTRAWNLFIGASDTGAYAIVSFKETTVAGGTVPRRSQMGGGLTNMTGGF